MDMLVLIVALSTIMWYLINRFKPLWAGFKYGKYITITIAALFGFGLAFGLSVDLLFAMGLVTTITIVGKIITGFALMAGSSAVSEILEAIGGKHYVETEIV